MNACSSAASLACPVTAVVLRGCCQSLLEGIAELATSSCARADVPCADGCGDTVDTLLATVQEQEGDQAGMLQTLRAALQWWRDSMADTQTGAEHPEHWLLSVRAMPVPAAAGSHSGYGTICCIVMRSACLQHLRHGSV